MARAMRIEYGGAVYHVMARGNQGGAIFADDLDRKLWLQTLAEVCEKTGWRVHAYVMMGNHYHLMVETPEGNLVAGMKWLQGIYTQRYNARHSVFGHLFQGRYKALVVEGEAGDYFGVVSTYIHLNPARTGLVRAGRQSLGAYLWSSYRWYLGGEGFRGQLLKRLKAAYGKGRANSYMGAAKRAHGEAEAERLLARGLAILGVERQRLENTPKGLGEKQVLAWWLRRRTTAGRRWIGERLWMGEESGVSKAVRRVNEDGDGALDPLKKRLVKGMRRDPRRNKRA